MLGQPWPRGPDFSMSYNVGAYPTRDHVIVFAQGYYGIFHLAEYSLLVGGKLKDLPPGIGTRQEVLAKYRLTIRA